MGCLSRSEYCSQDDTMEENDTAEALSTAEEAEDQKRLPDHAYSKEKVTSESSEQSSQECQEIVSAPTQKAHHMTSGAAKKGHDTPPCLSRTSSGTPVPCVAEMDVSTPRSETLTSSPGVSGQSSSQLGPIRVPSRSFSVESLIGDVISQDKSLTEHVQKSPVLDIKSEAKSEPVDVSEAALQSPKEEKMEVAPVVQESSTKKVGEQPRPSDTQLVVSDTKPVVSDTKPMVSDTQPMMSPDKPIPPPASLGFDTPLFPESQEFDSPMETASKDVTEDTESKTVIPDTPKADIKDNPESSGTSKSLVTGKTAPETAEAGDSGEKCEASTSKDAADSKPKQEPQQNQPERPTSVSPDLQFDPASYQMSLDLLDFYLQVDGTGDSPVKDTTEARRRDDDGSGKAAMDTERHANDDNKALDRDETAKASPKETPTVEQIPATKTADRPDGDGGKEDKSKIEAGTKTEEPKDSISADEKLSSSAEKDNTSAPPLLRDERKAKRLRERYNKLMEACMAGLSLCLQRLPQHHKSLYRLAYIYTYAKDYKVRYVLYFVIMKN